MSATSPVASPSLATPPRRVGSSARLWLGLLLPLGLVACGDNGDCTPTAQVITVQVRDSVTGLPAAGAAGGRIRSPSFYGTLTGVIGDPLTLTGAAPPGRYQLTIDAVGYQTWSESKVEVESTGSCSGKPVTVEARLQPN